MTRFLTTLVFCLSFALAAPLAAQEAGAENPRASTGGAQTLEDILARQRGEEVPTRERTEDPNSAAGAAGALLGQLGTRGAASDSDIWSALRFGTADVTVSTNKAVDEVLVQDSGMAWYEFRSGPLKTYGGWLLIGTLVALLLFYLIRGRIRIDGGRAGVTIERFKLIERTGHWALASSFIILGITGLVVFFGRIAFIPLFGKDAFALVAVASKWVHNWVAWVFMASLVLVFLLWVAHNIPNRHDLKWLAKAGGLFSKNVHPPARKFNAGQKMIFWAVIVLGGSISISGLSMLMPFDYPLFAKTFAALNALGLPALVGMAPLPEVLTPHAEMQLATLWHAIVSFVLMAIIFAHIYLGSVGMEGAYDAMGSGQVDLQWAKEHHGLWVKEVEEKRGAAPHGAGATTPAE